MPPTFAALHAPSPEAVPSTLPLTSSVAAALRSRGNRRASVIHTPPLGAFLPPIRDAPCLHGGVLPRAAPSPEAVPSSLRLCQNHLALPRSYVGQLFSTSLGFAAALRFGSPNPSLRSRLGNPTLSRLRRQASNPAPLRGVSGNPPFLFGSPEPLLRSAGYEACYFAEDAGGSQPQLPPRKPEPTP